MASFIQNFLVSFFGCLCVFYITRGNEYSGTATDGLPFCGIAESSSRYIFVSTLDGKLTALNPNNEGSVLWSVHPGSESMLSSSIHKLELSSYGHLVRMIPSLSGGLYKFNGENLEVIPVTADHLLESSFKYSDDLVISGGKETRTFGVSLKSGQIIYECSMKGCGNVSHSTEGNEVLVIQRLNQVVRAVEPRSGTEKWNFSVAQHDLKLLSECHSTENSELTYKLRVIVPEGLIYALDSTDSSQVIWKHQFESPVVRAWQLYRGKLVEVDLFYNHKTTNFGSLVPPSIYIGMHEKQLYIQESAIMLRKRQDIAWKVKKKLIGGESNYPQIPWKPISASSNALDITHRQLSTLDNPLDDASQRQTTALSVLYASSYVDGNGFYLYTQDDMEKVKKSSCNTSDNAITIGDNDSESESEPDPESSLVSDFADDFSEANTPVEIVIVSFWFYWKEVLVISITAFVCNLMITRTYLRWKIKGLSKMSDNNNSDSAVKESDSGIDMEVKLSKTTDSILAKDYTSRYLTDFDPVACLGKGGFGVVFEAKNKIDDCHYAIKRILLPNRLESRDRVMREVKALAKLDHHHIVRYFNAWTECPPPGWQEKFDQSWIDENSDIFTSSEVNSTRPTTIPSDTNTESQVLLNINSPTSVRLPLSRLEENPIYAKNDISDSFIVFGGSSGSSESDKKICENNKHESVIIFDTDTEESDKVKSLKISTKSERPTSLILDQKTSQDSENLNKVYLYIQMQLCQRQSLRDWLANNKERDYGNVLSIFEQILQAVEHVHLHGLIHRDLKPSNIFFSLDNQIKVGDFGLVTAMTEGDVQMSPTENVPVNVEKERHTAQVGTQLYMSQEQLLGKPYNYKVDIYSLGLILFELLMPFSTQMERVRVLQDIKNDIFPKVFQDKHKKEHKLLRLMLSHSPDERPTTYGVRARLPLKQEPVQENWHFDLPMRKRTSSKTYHNSTSSNEGS